jgi:hypothetical protein
MSTGNIIQAKALSIRNPWAYLIATGIKDIENRSWRYPPKYRGEFYIHVPQKEDSDGLTWLWANQREIAKSLPENLHWQSGKIIGKVDIVDVVTECDSPWFVGPLGFVLKNPVYFQEYQPGRDGQLYFFNVTFNKDYEPK